MLSRRRPATALRTRRCKPAASDDAYTLTPRDRASSRMRREPVQCQRRQQPNADLESGLIDVEPRRMIRVRFLAVAIRRRAADEEKEARHLLLVVRKILGAARLRHHADRAFARDALHH